MMHLDQMLDLQ